MTTHLKAFAIWLPLMTLLTLLGWLVLGALPGMRMTGDLVAWLAELPVVTCYAIAAGAATSLTMRATGMNLENAYRSELIKLAAAGDQAALKTLNQEIRAWLAFLAIWSLFFFPHW
jgi:hypothetical protein